MAGQEAILAEEIAAGVFEPPPGDELTALLADPDCGPPEGDDAWLGALASPARDAILDARAAAADAEVAAARAGAASAYPHAAAPDAGLAEAFSTGVLDHDGHGPGGPGFGSGSTLDGLEPGPVLTAELDDAWAAGLDRLCDDELAGLALAWRRCESRAAAGLLTAVGELSARRAAGGDSRVIEHMDAELACLLTLTRRSAGRLLDFAESLARLPATLAALASGRIDRARADVIAYETGLLDDRLAAAVEQLVIDDAPRLTTSQLAARLRRAVLAADPDAARRRQEEAAKDARVELINERSGTAGLAGRDLPVPAALAADQRIDSAARALKSAGAAATLPQLRAAVFLGLLTGQDPLTFLPPTEADEPSVSPTGSGDAGGGAHTEPGPSPDPGAGPLVQRGSVHLTMPLTAWLGLTQSPGDITGFGPATAETCRELADLIAQNPGSRWCLTLTDVAGHAVGHGCAHGPPPGWQEGAPDPPPRPSGEEPPDEPGAPPDEPEGPRDDDGNPPGGSPRAPRRPPAAPAPAGGIDRRLGEVVRWLTSIRAGPVEAGTCSHAREVPGYRIPESLHHIVKTRQRKCSAPWCSRPAIRCDDDHTLPHDQGGRTCECNLAPLCRTCHRAKQAQGWRLLQPSPGVLIWELPHGRRYLATPGVYPT